MFAVEGFILVGGRSTRMGTDKSRLLYDGQIAVDRIAAELRELTPRISLVGSGRVYGHFRIVPDQHQSWGALGGIQAALSACRAKWAVIVACDLPFLTGDLFARLYALSQPAAPELFDAVVPVQADGRPQPLCSLYRRDPCLREAEKLIAAGEHTPRALLAGVKTLWIRPAELADLAGAERFFYNVNTRSEYARAQAMLAKS